MIKNYLLIILTAMVCVISYSSFRMSSLATFHYKEANLASKVIKEVELDYPEYFYDVIVETDAYQNYINFIEK